MSSRAVEPDWRPTLPAEASAPEADTRRTSPIELLWDLVFVYAITQVTTLLSHDLSWAGLGRSMLVLALLWWAWSAFVWAANAQDPDAGFLRAALLVSLVLTFIAGLVIPRAFGGQATLFALTYTGVRLMHLALYADASRKGNASWSAIAGFAVTVGIGMALLVAGSVAGGSAQVVLWVLAAAIDYAGPAWLTRERLRGLQEVAVAHFAERYGLFVLICLGESIVAIGIGASGLPVSAELVAAVVFALLTTIGMWWIYFGQFAEAAEEHLQRHGDPVLAAADSYSYLHLLLIAGIVIFAVGVRFAVHGLGTPVSDAARAALCGGVALYLVGQFSFRWRLSGRAQLEAPATAGLVLVVLAVSASFAPWVVGALVSSAVGLVCLVERRASPSLLGD